MRQNTIICYLCILITLSLTSLGLAKQAKKQHKTWIDPDVARNEDPDFSIQGEYGSTEIGAVAGVQVIANGNGSFEAYLLQDGLPGIGWTREKKRTLLKGDRDGDKTVLKSADKKIVATISDGKLAITGADLKTALLPRIERTSPTLDAKAPAGAIILFDGNSTDKWDNGKLENGCLAASGCTTKQLFCNYTIHLEFRTPYKPTARGQRRGNSGIYYGGRWETQVLDSFGLEIRDDYCGGIYSIAKPILNMCLPPLSWQTYDANFSAAKFDAAGKRTAWPRITVKLNGVVVHDNLELTKNLTTSAPIKGALDKPEGPIYLQNHGNPVFFRNIWLVPSK